MEVDASSSAGLPSPVKSPQKVTFSAADASPSFVNAAAAVRARSGSIDMPSM